MNEILLMDGYGAYVWSAYGITLAVLIWNAWSARMRLRRNLAELEGSTAVAEPAPRAKVSQVED